MSTVTRPGPPVERLTRRLAQTPPEFLLRPRQGKGGTVRVDAVVADVLRDLGGEGLTDAAAKFFRTQGANHRNRLRLILVSSWLLADDAFRADGDLADQAGRWLRDGLDELAGLVDADLFVTDQERREELVRLCLAAMGFVPAGETPTQAADRVTALSSVERERVVAESRSRVEHARKVREAMAKKAAEEAAARYSRE